MNTETTLEPSEEKQRQQEYVLPCIHAETYNRFVEQMRKDGAETFDAFLQTILEHHAQVRDMEVADDDPESSMTNLLFNEDIFRIAPESRERFEALRAMYPEAYAKAVAFVQATQEKE
jgi:hypothetical protein